jgi:hypothetical protein
MSDFPLKQGARCGLCGGPCNALGCVSECAESRAAAIWNDEWPGTDEERLSAVKQIAESELRGVRPEFVSPAVIRIYRIVNAAGKKQPDPPASALPVEGDERG